MTPPTPSELRQTLVDTEAWLKRADAVAEPPAADDALLRRVEQAVTAWRQSGVIARDPKDGWHQGLSPRLLPELAVAYEASNDVAFARLARAIYQATLDAEPWHQGWQPTGKLDPLVIAHRLGDTECPGWFGTLPAFLSAVPFDDSFLLTLITSAVAQLNYLSQSLHPARNIRLSQADALLTQSLRLTCLPEAEHWRTLSVHVLNDGFHRLIAPDGASREATAWYHFIIMNMGLRLWRLQRADPGLGLTVTAAKVAAMFDYTLACIEPDGRATRIGDTIGDITPSGTLASFLTRRAEVLRELGHETTLPDTAQHFPHVGQALVRTDWTDRADYLTFDATAREGYHWHPGRNSVQLCLGGERVLADPGRMTYQPTVHRRYATSTRGHSTVNFNGYDQSDAAAWLRTASTPGCRLIEGVYDGGYWPIDDHTIGPGIYGRHRRTVLWMLGRFLLVIDHVSHAGGPDRKPDVEALWHFAPGQVDLDTDRRCAHAVHGSAQLNLHVALCPAATQLSLHEGQLEPTLGWAADDRTDQPTPAPSLCVRIAAHDPWRLDLATVLVPGRTDAPPPRLTVTDAHDASEKPHAHLRLAWEDGSRDDFWWTRDLATALDHVDSVTTDASLLHLHHQSGTARSGDQPDQVTLVDGTFANDWFHPRPDHPGLYAANALSAKITPSSSGS